MILIENKVIKIGKEWIIVKVKAWDKNIMLIPLDRFDSKQKANAKKRLYDFILKRSAKEIEIIRKEVEEWNARQKK